MTEAARLSAWKDLRKPIAGVVALRAARPRGARRRSRRRVMGANGAGKSTLMNVLGGVGAGDAARSRSMARRSRLRSARQAARHGIAFVHQELAMLPSMTVAENIFVDDLADALRPFVDGATWRVAERRACSPRLLRSRRQTAGGDIWASAIGNWSRSPGHCGGRRGS